MTEIIEVKPVPNRDLLVRMLGQIVLYPELHNQDSWVSQVDEVKGLQYQCMTAGCAAGWACALDPRVEWVSSSKPGEPYDVSLVETDDDDALYKVKLNGERTTVEDAAIEVLGLTYSEARRLFSGGNSTGDIIRVIREILDRADNKPTPPPSPEKAIEISIGKVFVPEDHILTVEREIDTVLDRYGARTPDNYGFLASCTVTEVTDGAA